jgi:hypothetical protein
MATTLVAETPAPSFDEQFDVWTERGRELQARLNETNATAEGYQWKLGDWLLKGEKDFGEKKAYDEAEQLTGETRNYLYNVVWVVNRFPNSSLRKETILKWSHFKELARIKDKKTREEVLSQVDDGLEHTVLEVRQIVDRTLNRISGSHGKERVKGVAYVRVPFTPNDRKLLKKLASSGGKTLDELLAKIVTDYLKANKSQIEKKLKKAEEKRRKQRKQ